MNVVWMFTNTQQLNAQKNWIHFLKSVCWNNIENLHFQIKKQWRLGYYEARLTSSLPWENSSCGISYHSTSTILQICFDWNIQSTLQYHTLTSNQKSLHSSYLLTRGMATNASTGLGLNQHKNDNKVGTRTFLCTGII